MKCSAARSVRAWDLTRDAERSAQSSSRLCHFAEETRETESRANAACGFVLKEREL